MVTSGSCTTGRQAAERSVCDIANSGPQAFRRIRKRKTVGSVPAATYRIVHGAGQAGGHAADILTEKNGNRHEGQRNAGAIRPYSMAVTPSSLRM